MLPSGGVRRSLITSIRARAAAERLFSLAVVVGDESGSTCKFL